MSWGKRLIKSIEMRSCTVARNDFGDFFRARYPRRFGAVLKQENVHIGIRLGVVEIGIQSLQGGLHRKVQPEWNSYHDHVRLDGT